MNGLKQTALGLFVGAMAIIFSSFTDSHRGLTGDWYLPKSSTLAAGTPAAKDFANYDAASRQSDPDDCHDATCVCAARFTDTDADPIAYEMKYPN